MKKIALTQGQYTQVDNQDFKVFNQWKWAVNGHGYAVRGTRNRDKNLQKSYLLHREILKAPKGMEVDHINGNRLDNRKENLRLATRQQNAQNGKKHKNSSSKFKGVHWHKPYKKWMAKIQGNFIGYFDSEKTAAKAYDLKAKELFGEFAKLNFGAKQRQA